MSHKSILPAKRNSIITHIADPKLSVVDGRLGYIREVFEDDEAINLTGIVCCVCNRQMRARTSDTRYCDEYWCSKECYNKAPYNFPVFKVLEKTSAQEEKTCDKCGGPARGRGFVHEDDCPEVLAKTQKRICPECSGPAKGRGFKHSDTCSLKTQPYVPKNGQEKNNH